MIKIEVTGTTLGEVADKLLAIGGSLLATDHKRIYEKGARAEARAIAADPSLAVGYSPEVAETAPVDPTPSSPPATEPSTMQSSEPAPKNAAAAEATDSQPTTPEPSSTPVPVASASELNFDTDVAPYVLQVVKEKGKPVAQEILSQFGVEKASLLDPAQWPELVDQLKGAL